MIKKDGRQRRVRIEWRDVNRQLCQVDEILQRLGPRKALERIISLKARGELFDMRELKMLETVCNDMIRRRQKRMGWGQREGDERSDEELNLEARS